MRACARNREITWYAVIRAKQSAVLSFQLVMGKLIQLLVSAAVLLCIFSNVHAQQRIDAAYKIFYGGVYCSNIAQQTSYINGTIQSNGDCHLLLGSDYNGYYGVVRANSNISATFLLYFSNSGSYCTHQLSNYTFRNGECFYADFYGSQNAVLITYARDFAPAATVAPTLAPTPPPPVIASTRVWLGPNCTGM